MGQRRDSVAADRGGAASDCPSDVNDAEEAAAAKSKNDGAQDAESKCKGEEKSDEKADAKEGSPMHGDSGDEGEDKPFKSLLQKAYKAAEEASRYAKMAAECSHQAAEAAETARHGRDQGSHNSLTKSIAHSAIVLTLTVVKAVRVVGYATVDVAAQCRIAARKFPECQGCGD
ncbi:unnamed protein product [Polarella glacialis]|uniref:Uncharacterized protein n=1 Tax=Polarella glacialis TaxID=89957 RepID=A0A813FU14_POLGL|nr:unnamed protein product [Polarella glacialis]